MPAKKILLVDDDPVSLYAQSVLLRAHYSVITATNGLQAWQLLQDKPNDFAVVLADRIMPHLHGLQLLTNMQAQPELSKIPFILLTGEAEKEEQVAAIRAGVFDFLYKPVAAELLLSVVRRAIKASANAGDNGRMTDE